MTDTPVADLGYPALRARMALLTKELEAINVHEKLTRTQERRAAEITGEYRDLALENVRRVAAGQGGGKVEPGVPVGDVDHNGSGDRDQAMRHLDEHIRSGDLDAGSAERVERLMRESELAPLAQRWAAAGSDPAYVRAFFKGLSGERGHMLWSPAEQAAYRRVEAVRAEMRAMTAGTTTTGGFQIPTIIDPAIRISSDGSISPIRQLAEVRAAIGSSFRPVT